MGAKLIVAHRDFLKFGFFEYITISIELVILQINAIPNIVYRNAVTIRYTTIVFSKLYNFK